MPGIHKEMPDIPLPPISELETYLVSLFYSSGQAMATGMGLVPLSFQEIKAWSEGSGIGDSLTPWQFTLIRRMSECYASEYSQATDPKRKSPYSPKTDEEEEIDRTAVMNKMKAMFKRINNEDSWDQE